VELLTVVAIIALLIGILMPALQAARNQAKNAKTAATLKSISDGLEMFRMDNEKDFAASSGYPPSARADDPTEEGQTPLFGAHWLVRYLMGKDLNGFVQRRSVPLTLQDPTDTDFEQERWYLADAHNGEPLPRVGPYIAADSVQVVKTRDLPGDSDNPTWNTMEQPVLADAFGYPILYYVANARLAERPGAHMAAFTRYAALPPAWVQPPVPSGENGVYYFDDNVIFTGMCSGTKESGTCNAPPWKFGGGDHHDIEYFGDQPGEQPTPDEIQDDPKTFLHYVMNKEVFTSTYDGTVSPPRATMSPYRKDSFLLVTAGKDAIYGSNDDVSNTGASR